MSRKHTTIARVMSCTCAVAVAFSSCENKKSNPTEVAQESTVLRESTTDITTTPIVTHIENAVTTTLATTVKKPVTTTTTATAYVAEAKANTTTKVEQIAIVATTSIAPVQEVQQTSVSVTEIEPVIQTEPVVVDISVPEVAEPMNFSSVEKSYSNGWNAPTFYSVEFGDCLSTIAEKFSCEEQEIKDANLQVTDWNLIMPGDNLIIPMDDAVETYYSNSYTVESGDCLTIISQKLDCNVEELIMANPNVNWECIQPGQIIVNPTPFEVVDNQANVPNWCEPSTTENMDVTTITQAEVETTIVETVPAEPTPVETAPVPATPVETEPVTETTIVETTSVETTTVSETTKAETTTTKKTTQKTVAEVTTTKINSAYFEKIEVEDISANEVQTNENSSAEGDTSNEDCTSNEPIIFENGSLPEDIMAEVERQMQKYPGMEVAVGLYSLNGNISYTYNEYKEMAAGCTVKAAYALYVLKTCEERGIDIWTYKLTYREGMLNNGSGDIKTIHNYGDELTIGYLLEKLLRISDNTAYNILCSEFGLDGYQAFLYTIGGQNLYGVQYGIASVEQRKNEWFAIYDYVNSEAMYAQTLRNFITNSPYCYLCDGMADGHEYMHKSGWSDENMSYTCAADCAIVDNSYLLIVITQDYSTGIAHTDTVRSLGYVTEQYVYSNGI